jgi:hypothetical protein
LQGFFPYCLFADARFLVSRDARFLVILKQEKSMKRLGIALILTCALSVSALAGDIPTIGVASPPPPPTQSTSSSIATTILLTVIGLIR